MFHTINPFSSNEINSTELINEIENSYHSDYIDRSINQIETEEKEKSEEAAINEFFNKRTSVFYFFE